jgi:hypothetical protein
MDRSQRLQNFISQFMIIMLYNTTYKKVLNFENATSWLNLEIQVSHEHYVTSLLGLILSNILFNMRCNIFDITIT